MTDTTTHAGGCLCGEVRFEARGAPERVLACHCTMCRQHTGAPFVVLAVYRPESVTVRGETLDYRSSARVLRRRCALCGAQLLIVSEESGVLEIYSGCFDDPAPFAPQYEIFGVHRPHWLPPLAGVPVHERFRE